MHLAITYIDKRSSIPTMSMDLDIENEESDGSVRCDDAAVDVTDSEDENEDDEDNNSVESEHIVYEDELPYEDEDDRGAIEAKQEEEKEEDTFERKLASCTLPYSPKSSLTTSPSKKSEIEQKFVGQMSRASQRVGRSAQSVQSFHSHQDTSNGSSGHNQGGGRRHRSTERGNASSSHRQYRSSSCQIGYSRHSTDVAVSSRPDPEEFPCGGSVVSSRSHQRRQQSSRSAPKRSNSFNNQVSSSSFASHQGMTFPFPPPPPPPPPPPRNFRGLTGVSDMGGHPPPVSCQDMVVAAYNDDEVSTLSNPSQISPFANFIPPPPPPTAARFLQELGSCYDDEQDDDDDDLSAVDEEEEDVARQVERELSSPVGINTNEYDSKGRCKHHSHIRLRKKKLFGRGWKVMMSACPDCCVDELRRMRCIEENRKRMKEKKTEKADRSIGGLDDSGRSGASRASSRSSRRSLHRSNSNRSIRSSSCSIGSGSRYNDRQLLRSSTSSSSGYGFIPPPPPPRRTPSLPPRSPQSREFAKDEVEKPLRVMVVPLDKSTTSKDTVRTSFSDETASLTASSASGSSNEQQQQQQKGGGRTRSLSLSNIRHRRPSLEKVNTTLQNIRQLVPVAHQDADDSSRSGDSQVKSKAKKSDKDAQQDDQAAAPRGTIHVRQMQWTDPKNGKSGMYTGQCNGLFIPHGHGVLEYDDTGDHEEGHVKKTKEGEWKNGRYRRRNGRGSDASVASISSSRSNRSNRSKSKEGKRSRSISRRHSSSSSVGGTRRRSSSISSRVAAVAPAELQQ